MSIKDIPRAAVGGYLKVARIPLDQAARLLGRDTTELDRADAAVRDAAGTVLGDEELRNDARRRRTALDEREKAETLRAAAQATKQQADEELQERKQSAAEQRRRAAQTAEKRRTQAERQKATRQKKAAEAERKRKEAAEQTAAKREEVIEDKAKRERLEQLDREAGVLEEREEALTAADEAQRLRDEAAKLKAERKNGQPA